MSEHRNPASEAHSLPGDGRGRELSGHAKKPTDRGPLTDWRQQKKALLRTRKETGRPRPTHQLETAEAGTCQDTERNCLTEAHSHPGDGKTEGFVRTQKETDQPRHTHRLEITDGGVCQNTERNQLTKAHSLSGDGRERSLSGHGKKPTKRGPLTSWRW